LGASPKFGGGNEPVAGGDCEKTDSVDMAVKVTAAISPGIFKSFIKFIRTGASFERESFKKQDQQNLYRETGTLKIDLFCGVTLWFGENSTLLPQTTIDLNSSLVRVMLGVFSG
jgi:hypothetical protein